MPLSEKKTDAATATTVAKSPFFRPTDNTTANNSNKNNGNNNGDRLFRTPGGTTRRVIKTNNNSTNDNNANENNNKEHKSTVLGCSANLVNAIVGSGIVGLPFAIQESGFVPGIVLVLFCALLCEKSLRLLVETAKHSNVPSYETVMEAAYGRFGFLFVAINMFIMAYGAMLSYLMIVKDTFSSILGIGYESEEDILMRRAVLIAISSLVILPLSCQRDMADLAKTSKINVVFDLIMVLVVVYLAFNDDNGIDDNDYVHDNDIDGIYDNDNDNDTDDIDAVDGYFNSNNNNNNSINLWKVRWDTIFVGLGVLSFAFVCQHSSFIIAGSLDRPTQQRWSHVTKIGVGFAASLALLMGISGYLGFANLTTNGNDAIRGNILNSLPSGSRLAKIAKGLLGTTMLFVYPMESFVARHSCVVLLFQGRKAHEGDDASVLNRRDRRITLTVVLYLCAVIPAALFEDLGNVLAVSGAVGGSCLSYIGPGIVYIGIHGGRLLELSEAYFGRGLLLSSSSNYNDNDDDDEESTPLMMHRDDGNGNGNGNDANDISKTTTINTDDGFLCKSLKTLQWYLLGMPIWCGLASIGRRGLTSHVTEMALKSPHPIRIGNVRFARAKILGGDAYTRVVMLKNNNNNNNNRNSSSSSATSTEQLDTSYSSDNNNNNDQQHFGRGFVTTKLLRADSLPKVSNESYKMQTMKDGMIVALPPSVFLQQKQSSSSNYQSINQKIGAMAAAKMQQQQQNEKKEEKEEESEDIAIEDDPQRDPPAVLDFVFAVGYVIFGVIAMFAGLASIFFS